MMVSATNMPPQAMTDQREVSVALIDESNRQSSIGTNATTDDVMDDSSNRAFYYAAASQAYPSPYGTSATTEMTPAQYKTAHDYYEGSGDAAAASMSMMATAANAIKKTSQQPQEAPGKYSPPRSPATYDNNSAQSHSYSSAASTQPIRFAAAQHQQAQLMLSPAESAGSTSQGAAASHADKQVFLYALYHILSNQSSPTAAASASTTTPSWTPCEDIITWLPHGKGFIICNKPKFEKEVLPTFLPNTKYASFTRRLKRWRFVR